MQKRTNLLTSFVIVSIVIAIVSIVLQTKSLEIIPGVFQFIFSPFQKILYSSVQKTWAAGGSTSLEQENALLRQKLVKQKSQEDEIHALRDQFQSGAMKSSTLLPVGVIGARGFLPGISQPEELIINKGSSAHVKNGMVVIYQDNIIGRVTKISPFFSSVQLISNSQSSFTGKEMETNALGIIKGGGNGTIIFNNVVTSDVLKNGDTVLSKGDQESDGTGFPPNLIVGKIISIDRKPSSLFQSAEIKSTVDFTRLTSVFLVTY